MFISPATSFSFSWSWSTASSAMVEQEPGPPGVLGSAEIWRPSSDADPKKKI